MFALRTVTARQFVELLAKGETVEILVGEYGTVTLVSAELQTQRVSVRWSDGGTGTYYANERYQIVDQAATDEMREAEAKAEYEAERAAERYFEEGPHGPQDDPRERALWAMEDEAAAMRHATEYGCAAR